MDGLTLPQQALICLTYGVTLVCSGLALYGTARRFLTVRSLGWGKAILFLTFGISTGMVIWVGDPNLLYVFPLFVFFSMLSTQGDWMGRLAVTIIFFCIIMSVCAILDTYIALFDLFTIDTSDFLCRLMRPLFFALLYLLIRRRMPVMEAHSGLVLHALVRADGSGFADLSQVGLDGGQLHGHEPGDGGSPLHWCDGADSFVCHFNPGQP